MKRTLIVFALFFLILPARCDVIFFPRYPNPYSLLNYSVEFIYSYELAKKIKSSTAFWGGFGYVGSIILDEPTAGFEIAVERRRYFKSEQFKNFFISGYVGAAYMTNFSDRHDLGLVPGFKFNYKAPLWRSFVLEPYIGLSLPIAFDMSRKDFYFPLPAATIGIRLGICKLKKYN